jgi:hypothetical protein
VRARVLERPDAFIRLAGVDDETLDRLIASLDLPTPAQLVTRNAPHVGRSLTNPPGEPGE